LPVSILPALFKAAIVSAVHLETRDAYEPDDPDWPEWRDGHRFDPAVRWAAWFDMTSETTARGVQVRRLRIVSEPVTEYVRYEYDVTAGFNIASGEEVRWLPRDRAVGLLLPAVDCWIFDEKITVANHFDGYGGNLRHEQFDDAALSAHYTAAFNRVWERAVPHMEYAI
jgi:hypothetical protein